MIDVYVTMKDACRLLGISPQMVREYEGYGLASRYHVEANGYRRFNGEDIAQMFELRKLGRAGVTVREAVRMQSGADLREYTDTCADAAEALRERIRQQEILLEALRNETRLLRELPKRLGRFKLATSPAMRVLPCTAGAKVVSDPALVQAIRRCAGALPPAFFGLYLPVENIVPGCICELAVGVDERFAGDVLDEEGLACAWRLPPTPCLSWVLDIDLAYAKEVRQREGYVVDDQYECFEGALAWVAARGLELHGCMTARLLVSGAFDERGVPHDYYDVWIPVHERAARHKTELQADEGV